MDDKQLRRNVLDELEFEPSVDAANIGVAIKDGIVTLTGHVTSYAEKLAAERAVRQVKGVRGIAQEIEVRYGGITSDDEIAKRALNMLKWQAMIPSDAVKVTVQKGLVILSGEVIWQYQRKSAEDSIRKLSGVTGIVNNISIKPTVAVADIKKKIEDALTRHAQIEAQAIRVNVRDGKVSLDGKVETWNERDAVENAAWSVAGVQSVEDRLTIG
jgi:osmotically-inducible protein OsmY